MTGLRWLMIAALAGLMAVAACGRKGDPQPPSAVKTPEAPATRSDEKPPAS